MYVKGWHGHIRSNLETIFLGNVRQLSQLDKVPDLEGVWNQDNGDTNTSNPLVRPENSDPIQPHWNHH